MVRGSIYYPPTFYARDVKIFLHTRNTPMSTGTLYDKVWDRHTVRTLPTGQTQLFVGLHLIHEVTSPQAFGMLQERDMNVAFPDRTFATSDHIVPTADLTRPLPMPRRRR